MKLPVPISVAFRLIVENGFMGSLTGLRTLMLPAAAAIPFGYPIPLALSGRR